MRGDLLYPAVLTAGASVARQNTYGISYNDLNHRGPELDPLVCRCYKVARLDRM